MKTDNTQNITIEVVIRDKKVISHATSTNTPIKRLIALIFRSIIDKINQYDIKPDDEIRITITNHDKHKIYTERRTLREMGII